MSDQQLDAVATLAVGGAFLAFSWLVWHFGTRLWAWLFPPPKKRKKRNKKR